MNDVAVLEISVRHADGTRQKLTVDSATALVGSGSHCEVRLPSEDAAVEQLRFSIDAAGVFGQVRSLERNVTLNGAPFVEGRLLPGSVLGVGRVELTVAVIETLVARGQAKQKRNSSRQASYALAILGLPLGFYLLLSQSNSDAALPNEVEPPPLFAAAGSVQCPETEHDAALAVAAEERRRAEIARERAPFSGQDAVNAVAAFRRSAACFTLADSLERAGDSVRQADALERDVQTEFHVHRVRLERALATKSYEEARTEVRLLLSYIGRHSGAYANWLLSLDRRIELEIFRKEAMMSSRISLLAVSLALWLGACAHNAKQPQTEGGDAQAQQVATWLQHARQLADAADYTRAEQYLNLAAKHGGDPAQVMPLLIDVCVRDQRYRAALQYAEEHLRRHPRAYRLRYIEATLLRALGDIGKSRQELQRVIDASPDYADAHYSMAILLRDQLGSYVEADLHFREYLRLAPRGQHAEEADESLLEAMP